MGRTSVDQVVGARYALFADREVALPQCLDLDHWAQLSESSKDATHAKESPKLDTVGRPGEIQGFWVLGHDIDVPIFTDFPAVKQISPTNASIYTSVKFESALIRFLSRLP